MSAAAYVGFRLLRNTPFGMTLEGIRDDPVRMASLGFNVPLHRTLAFGLGGFVAGIAGVLSIWWNGQIDPNSVAIGATLDLLVVAVIGGINHLEGAWLGAFVFVAANNYLRSLPLVDQHRHHPGAVQHGRRARRAAHRRRLTQRSHRPHPGGGVALRHPPARAGARPRAAGDRQRRTRPPDPRAGRSSRRLGTSTTNHHQQGENHMNTRTAKRGRLPPRSPSSGSSAARPSWPVRPPSPPAAANRSASASSPSARARSAASTRTSSPASRWP